MRQRTTTEPDSAARPPFPQGQKGVALITALLVVALAAAAAVAMAARQQVDLRRASNVLHFDQAYLYALGGEAFASRILDLDLQNGQKNGFVDSLDEDWAQPLPATPVDGGQVGGYLEDMEGRFNLNNLVAAAQTGQNATGPNTTGQNPSAQAADYLAYFRNLLQVAGVDNASEIEAAVLDWVDSDINTRSDGAEDTYYEQQNPPYRAANQRFWSPSELRLVRGVTDEVYEKLAPLITVLPTPTTINVNTAPAQVLQALVPGMSASTAANLVTYRKDQRFAKKTDFEQELQKVVGSANRLPQGLINLIDVKSDHFLLHANVQMGHVQMRLTSVLERKAGATQTQVLLRSLGTY